MRVVLQFTTTSSRYDNNIKCNNNNIADNNKQNFFMSSVTFRLNIVMKLMALCRHFGYFKIPNVCRKSLAFVSKTLAVCHILQKAHVHPNAHRKKRNSWTHYMMFLLHYVMILIHIFLDILFQLLLHIYIYKLHQKHFQIKFIQNFLLFFIIIYLLLLRSLLYLLLLLFYISKVHINYSTSF